MFTILKRRICALCTDSALSVYRARFYSPAVDSVLQHHDVHSPAVDGTCVKCYDPRCIIWAEVRVRPELRACSLIPAVAAGTVPVPADDGLPRFCDSRIRCIHTVYPSCRFPRTAVSPGRIIAGRIPGKARNPPMDEDVVLRLMVVRHGRNASSPPSATSSMLTGFVSPYAARQSSPRNIPVIMPSISMETTAINIVTI